MYLTKLTIPDVVRVLPRDLPARTRAALNVRVERTVQPALEVAVRNQVAPYPGPVRYPFEFSTAKSRRWYFWKFKGRLPRQRTGELGRSWTVRVDRRSGEILIYNRANYAGWVLGPGNALANFRQVPGHRRTGWGRNLNVIFAGIQEYGTTILIQAWYDVIKEVWR